MKKGLLLIAGAALATSAYAQQEIGYMSAGNSVVAAEWGWSEESNAFSKDKVEHAAGTLMAETEHITLRTTFVDNSCSSSCSASGVTYFVVNGVEYKKESNAENCFQGAVGNTNPAAIDINNIIENKGWVLDYEAKADGYLIVFGKVSVNKNTYVLEGSLTEDGINANGAIAYEFYGVNDGSKASYVGNDCWTYKLPADADGYVDMNASDINKYVDAAGAIMWPYRICAALGQVPCAFPEGEDGNYAACTDTGDGYPGVFSGVVFPVYEGVHYYYFCTGSKVTAGPYVYTKEYPTQFACVHTDEEGVNTVYDFIGSYDGVENVAVEANENAPIYNLNGVRVNADAKGILIQNGKKIVRF